MIQGCLAIALMFFIHPQTRVATPRVDASTPRERQIELAESAAPADVNRSATIYILGHAGYEKAREGTNGFSCLIDREFIDTLEPECFDAEGSATTLKVRLFQEELRAKGVSDEEIVRRVEKGYQAGTFIAPRKSGIVYMLSKENWVFDPDSKKVINFPPHLMFYAPYMTQKDLGGSPAPGMPYLVHPGQPDTLMIVVPASSDHAH